MKITNRHTAPVDLGFVTLRPGDSCDVPAKHIKAVKENPLFLGRLLREGSPTPVETQEPNAPEPPVDVANMIPEQAIGAIAACYRLDVLKAWAATEKRLDVMLAIKAQIAKVNATANP